MINLLAQLLCLQETCLFLYTFSVSECLLKKPQCEEQIVKYLFAEVLLFMAFSVKL